MAAWNSQEMAELFALAERGRLWFFNVSNQLWLTPQELRGEQIAGRFRWGTINWLLRNPNERLRELHDQFTEAQREYERVKALIDGDYTRG